MFQLHERDDRPLFLCDDSNRSGGFDSVALAL